MYPYIQKAGIKQFIQAEAPAIGLSMLIAEMFFKFGSFSVEAVAFLTTWFAISALFELSTSLINRNSEKTRQEA